MQQQSVLETELAWLLKMECASVLGRIRKLLLGCAEVAEYVEGTKPETVRGGELEDGLRFSAAVNGTAVEGLQVQLSLSQLDQEGPVRLAMPRGQNVKLVLPQLLTWKNLLSNALSVITAPGTCNSLQAACTGVNHLGRILNQLLCAWPLEVPLSGPSSTANAVSQLLQPKVPPQVYLDVCIAGVPPRFYVSAYPSRDAQGGVEPVHASASVETLETSMTRALTAQRLCKDLLEKLNIHKELQRERR